MEIPKGVVPKSFKVPDQLIYYPRLMEFHDNLAECLEMSVEMGEPNCMAIKGRTGSGKTWLTYSLLESFGTEGGYKIIYLLVPSPATIKGVMSKLLQSLGDPFYDAGSILQMDRRIAKLIEEKEIDIIVLDEFSNIVRSNASGQLSDHVLLDVSHWLKTFIKTINLPIVVVGIEDKVDAILDSNEELAGLFGTRKCLLPLKLSSNKTSQISRRGGAVFEECELSIFLLLVENALNFKFSKELSWNELASRIHYATDGYIRYIMTLCICAKRIAKAEDTNEITLSILKRTFDKKLSINKRQKSNVFSLPAKHIFKG